MAFADVKNELMRAMIAIIYFFIVVWFFTVNTLSFVFFMISDAKVRQNHRKTKGFSLIGRGKSLMYAEWRHFPDILSVALKSWEKVCLFAIILLPLHSLLPTKNARVAKLVDAPDLGSGVLRCAGSSPVRRTTTKKGRMDHHVRSAFFIPTPAYRRHKSTENPPKTKESPQIHRKIRHLF